MSGCFAPHTSSHLPAAHQPHLYGTTMINNKSPYYRRGEASDTNTLNYPIISGGCFAPTSATLLFIAGWVPNPRLIASLIIKEKTLMISLVIRLRVCQGCIATLGAGWRANLLGFYSGVNLLITACQLIVE